MTGSKLYILILLLLLTFAQSAGALSVTTSVDKDVVGLGDPITLDIKIVGDGGSAPDPTLPDLSDFDIYSSGRSQNISIVNGQFSSTVDMSYILVPKKIGVLIIGPVTVSHKKNMASSEPIKITVEKPGQINSNTQTKPPAKAMKGTQKLEEFFIEQSVDKSRPYIGEQIILTFKFYQAETLWENPDLKWPEYVGFTVEDLPPNSRKYEMVNGRRYLVTEIKRALFAISAGPATIESPNLQLRSDSYGSMRDPFSIFDRRRTRNKQPTVLTTDPIKLNVRELPKKGRPASFNGAVGSYRLSMQVNTDSVGVDEPITMTVRLSGRGNIKSLPPINIPELDDFRVYESGSTESIDNSNYVVSGVKVFEQAVIPKTSGIFEIPSLEYSYFNPGSGKYVTVKTDAVTVTASGEGMADLGGAPRNIIGADKKSLGYIITEYHGSKNGIDLYGSFWYWLLQLIPFMGILAAMVARSHYRKLMGDRNYARRVSAKRRSKAFFKSAISKKDKEDYTGFYSELIDSVLGFVADRLSLDKSALTVDDIRQNYKIESGIKQELAEFIERCDAARFSSLSSTRTIADRLLVDAENILTRLEKTI